MLSPCPQELVAIYAVEAVVRSNKLNCTYYEKMVSHSWPIFIPHLLRPVLKGYAAKLSSSGNERMAAIVGTMSIGLSFDLAFFQNSSSRVVEEKYQNPTTSAFKQQRLYQRKECLETCQRDNSDF